jgi:hypothetical protein
MASKAGIYDLQFLAPDAALTPQHNVQSATPGLPVKASEIIYAGCLVAFDPANSQAQSADPAMPATAKVIGAALCTVDNRTGAKGDLQVTPHCGVMKVKNDGTITAAQLYTMAVIVDDHTVGAAAGTNADRPAGLIVGMDGTGFVWLLILPESAKRGPVTVTLTSTNGTAAAASASLANLAAEAENIGDDVRAIYAALVTAGIIAPAA